MELKVIARVTYTPFEDNHPLKLKTRYFSDGSSIILTEKGICLVENVGLVKYDLHREDG